MPSKKEILGAITEHGNILSDCYAKSRKIAELLVDNARIKREQEEKSVIAEFNEQIAEAKKKRGELLHQIHDEYETSMENEQQLYEESMQAINDELNILPSAFGWPELDFNHELWTKYSPVKRGEIPKLTRIGELTAKGKNSEINFPALVPIIGSQHVFIKATGQAKDEAMEVIQCLMLRLLAGLAPGKLNFILIDPVGLGSNMAGFMHLPKELIGGKAWTEANHIEQRLADLSEHMEMVIQKYLKNRYENMEEYNNKAGEVAEPYRVLVIANFPVNFTDSAARRLINIASNGPRTGVHVLATIDKNQPKPHGLEHAELFRTGTVFDFDDNRFIWQDSDFKNCALQFDQLPPTELFNQIVFSVTEGSKEAQKVEVPFETIAPAFSNWWESNTRDGLIAPIGKLGADDQLLFDLGKGTAQHALIAGKTGSGKSNLLHVIIMSLALKYSPDELEFYLIDFKKGIEFKDYAVWGLPHARVIAIQSEREFGASVLQGLDKELQRRGDLFREKGVSGIQEFRDKFTPERMPRIFLLVDEYQEFFSEDDAFASQASLILDRLVRQGRAFGIHVLLASQSMASSYNMSRSTIEQMAVRVALQCSEADSRLILGDENPAARLLSRPGEAIYNAANGAVEGNILFQVLLLKDDSRESLLQKIRQKTNDGKLKNLSAPIIFEGNAPADFESNYEVMNLINSKVWPQSAKAVKAWLGEPIAIKPHTSALFRKQSRSNLLIMGQNEEAATAMLLNSMIGLAAQQSPSEASFAVINLSNVDADWHDLPAHLTGSFSHEIKIAKRRDILITIQDVATLVKKRMENTDSRAEARLYLTIIGLNRARDLRSEDSYTPSSGAEDLNLILREGPDIGIHTLIWCDTIANFERVLERRMLAEFDMRVALQMSLDDSNSLIDNALANKLEPHRALFYDEERAGSLEKFRPYSLPKMNFIKEMGTQLGKRTNS